MIRTDQAKVFMGKDFEDFRTELVGHFVYPLPYDHRSNGKVERIIRTISERLRANPKILTDKKNQLFYEVVSALRISKKRDGKLPFENMTGRRPNTSTTILVGLYKQVKFLDYDRSVHLEKLDEFPSDNDSIISVRDQLNKGKLAKLFKKRRGIIKGESSHTVTLEEKGKQFVLSKREITKAPATAEEQRKARKQNQPRRAVYYQKEITKIPNDLGALKATVDQPVEKPTTVNSNETTEQSPRARRARRAPEWFGNPITICDIESKKE